MIDLNQQNAIDESLYSRQLYVLGHDAMRKMQNSNILICGMGGLGVEIAKNIILGGVKSVTIHDTANATNHDLSSQYFLHEEDIGKNRAECSRASLSELNTYVRVIAHTDELSEGFLKNFQVVVLTDSSNEEQIKIGDFCHNNDIKFIVADTKGVFGKIFCDFGKSFKVLDVNGQACKTAMISHITNDTDGIVTTFDEQRHDLEDGNYVTFKEIKGMTELNGKEFKIKVIGPFTFSIGDTSNFGLYENGGIVTEVKKPKKISFDTISEAIKKPSYVISDYTKMTDSDTIHIAFQALSEFKSQKSSYPRAWNKEDAELFQEISKTYNSKLENPFSDLNESLLKLFAAVSSGNLCPLQAVIGGVVAQEVMKACSGKFHPIHNYFYFDCREVLPTNALENLGSNNYIYSELENRYVSQVAVFGNDFQKKLEEAKCFLVGSGALGCEYIKNFAMMGLACSSNGKITVTDMDTIEKSNLNRQFLFRSWDVQKPKAEVSSAAAKKMNPGINITANLNRVGPETEDVYNTEFFSSLDVICNALDNVGARLYIDSKSIEFQKPLIESGTLGTEGNVQVVLPFITEAYSSSRDPPEKSIPICTLKIFPNSIEHTLQWARDMFEGLFNNSAVSALNFINDSKVYLHGLKKLNPQQQLEELRQLDKVLVTEKCVSFEECVIWARKLWQESFHNIIKQLIFNFPPDCKTSHGLPFWSGPKRCPHPLEFDHTNNFHLDFIFAASNLKALMHGLKQIRDTNTIIEILKNIKVDEFKPKEGVKIKVNDQEESNDINDDDEMELKNLIVNLEAKRDEIIRDVQLTPIEFEKDDDKNLHMDFITACSNLRATNYDIETTDKHNSKLIAGKIIPAIATTTAVIVGLDCIELYKVIQGHKNIESYKNSFINLALPFFSSSEPMAVPKNKFNDTEWSLWDRIEIKGDIKIREFIDYFNKEYNLKVSMIAQDVVTIYSDFLSKEKLKDRLEMTITEAYELIKKERLPKHIKTLTLIVACCDSNDEDIDIPLVKYVL